LNDLDWDATLSGNMQVSWNAFKELLLDLKDCKLVDIRQEAQLNS